uniref:Nucleoside diphosphate kinase putative n=1 Tax=Albugo laibachii Nc14 TaxID=890382 RepID=F0VZB0_9STRA|nr:nucleoside diphosphate kinase putative [Albugo laibachii Nc14]|eukprot:CCA14140.1 nucleoside diphosphate kinase putative [Albugo laibachii Nc14]
MKEHPEQVEKPRACGRGSTNSDLNAHSADVSFTKLCDLQPETIVNVRCRLREPKEKEDRIIGTLNGLETNFGAYRRHVEMTDGTLGESQAVTLCLWDQQAHKKHIESLLDHDGTFEILNLIITLDGNAKFLLANSSSATLFVKWTTSNSLKLPENAPQPVISEEKVALCKSIDSSAMCPKNKSGNIFFLEDVRVERVDFGKPLGSPSCVRPPFTPLLIECCCRFCEETLPRFNANVIPILYMSCPKRQCKIKRSKRKQTTLIRTIDEIDSSTDEVKACFWRYRAITMRLRAIREIKPHLYTVTAQDPVIQNLAGNIKASLLVDSETFLSNDFDAKWRVASCLNSIVRSNSRFQAALQMVTEDDSTQFSPANTPTWAFMSEQKLSFFAEWHDPQSDQVKQYILNWFPDQTLELVERQNNRVFLKRIRIPTISTAHVNVGAIIMVYARQLRIIAAANEFTHQQLTSGCSSGKMVCIIPPDMYNQMGDILEVIQTSGTLLHLEMMHITHQLAQSMSCASIVWGKFTIDQVVSHSENSVSILVFFQIKQGSTEVSIFDRMRQRGWDCDDSILFLREYSKSGITQMLNTEIPRTTAIFDRCTLCILRPRLVQEGRLGHVVRRILHDRSFEISAMRSFHLTLSQADEFFQAYKLVVARYQEMISYMSSNVCIALEIRGDGDTVSRFREFCGPFDVEIAQALYSNSLRASFGSSKSDNGIHCTDCSEDGVLESYFFFHTLLH